MCIRYPRFVTQIHGQRIHGYTNNEQMKLSLKIALRYLFAKKSTNAINIISGISVLGLALGAAALVLVLSVFNGFEKLITGMMSNFNPDVKIIPAKGKTFTSDTLIMNQLRQISSIEQLSETLEETAFFEYLNNFLKTKPHLQLLLSRCMCFLTTGALLLKNEKYNPKS